MNFGFYSNLLTCWLALNEKTKMTQFRKLDINRSIHNGFSKLFFCWVTNWSLCHMSIFGFPRLDILFFPWQDHRSWFLSFIKDEVAWCWFLEMLTVMHDGNMLVTTGQSFRYIPQKTFHTIHDARGTRLLADSVEPCNKDLTDSRGNQFVIHINYFLQS